MNKQSSGLWAVTVFAAGLFWNCGESSVEDAAGLPESDDGVQEIGLSQASSAGADKGISSGENHAVASSDGTPASASLSSSVTNSSGALSSSSLSSQGSSASLPTSSSSEMDFVYVAPANFSDTVNGTVFNMVYVTGGTYTRGCDNCAEQDKIYETPAHQVTVGAELVRR